MGAVKTKLLSGTSSGDGIKIELLQTGDIRTLTAGPIMINQLVGNYLDGMAANIYLRIYDGKKITPWPLMGKASESTLTLSEDQVRYDGEAGGLRYRVTLFAAENLWFFDVCVENPVGSAKPVRIDLVYTQDIGLAAWGHTRSNEAYNAQYIDHRVFTTDRGYVIASRQNQGQSTGFPFLQQGTLGGRAASFSVDGYPLYGLSYKFDNTIAELTAPVLNNRVYQYEYAFSALQTEPVDLGRERAETAFYGYFLPDLEGAVEGPVPIAEIEPVYTTAKKQLFNSGAAGTKNTPLPRIHYDIDVNNTYASPSLREAELEKLYPEKRQTELDDRNGKKLLSFFTGTGAHVVLAEKERLTERPHGNIIITGQNDFIREDLLTTTQYIYGVFNSQIALGNTSFNKIISNCRNALNVQKISGQRLMVRLDGRYRLLTMPAVYEMGLNYGRWLYKIGEDILEVRCFTAVDRPLLCFTVQSLSHLQYDFLLYSQTTGGADEYIDKPAVVTRNENQVTLRHGEDSFSRGPYPHLEFVMHFDRDFTLTDDSRFYKEATSMGETLAVMEFTGAEGFSYTLEGRIDGPAADITMEADSETAKYLAWMQDGLRGFKLSIDSPDDSTGKNAHNLEALTILSLWYSHNARIHFSSPHGLEQYGGAAWGTRDVCQGPFEYFMAAQNHAAARRIIEQVYAKQFDDDGTWPQWFMFDRYDGIRADQSHGDVIFWPLKTLVDYISATGDTEILSFKAPYIVRGQPGHTPESYPVLTHLQKQIQYIRNNCIPGTALIRYGEGDWDDTLQPHDPALREKMTSGWTVALSYQIFSGLAAALKETHAEFAEEIAALAAEIQQDFYCYVLKDGVTAGFVIFDKDGERRMLHPSDRETGLKYRLLPMTRSMTAELFGPEEAAAHLQLIKTFLYHPDGVRLMDRTCTYRGGINTFFKRAETASNFGREIGLQYVHAHIRFVEAMAKTGNADEAWLGLLRAAPLLRCAMVKQAEPCQANGYFSSSDACFDNRYDAMRDFDKLRTGDIPVKTGWRIYSSGPGIYLNQLISNVLGLRVKKNRVIIDPVLPQELDGLQFTFAIHTKPVTITYHITGAGGVKTIKVNNREIPFDRLPNTYRSGGAIFPDAEITANAAIDVYL
ncbi:hypothetical protein FACS1894141_0840 [Spirochaetia bacterium]|nr:hypothetical protein FACS1894141_0840 [Spirochaetia bacterium]